MPTTRSLPDETHPEHVIPLTVMLLLYHIELRDVVFRRGKQCNRVYGLDHVLLSDYDFMYVTEHCAELYTNFL